VDLTSLTALLTRLESVAHNLSARVDHLQQVCVCVYVCVCVCDKDTDTCRVQVDQQLRARRSAPEASAVVRLHSLTHSLTNSETLSLSLYLSLNLALSPPPFTRSLSHTLSQPPDEQMIMPFSFSCMGTFRFGRDCADMRVGGHACGPSIS
jgi:hypothetical protein